MPGRGFVLLLGMKFISYLRASTRRQGIEGLGISAQREAVRRFLAGSNGELVAEFAEVESGKLRDRPELEKAIAACHRTGARLVIARLDRLARNAGFLFGLRDAGLEFVCCDMPQANPLTIGILAVVAEDEARRISDRTRAGLQAAKRKGIKLGNPRIAEARMKAAEANKRKARDFAAKMAPIITKIQKTGQVTAHDGIAEVLNVRGIRTVQGKEFSKYTVRNLLKLIAR